MGKNNVVSLIFLKTSTIREIIMTSDVNILIIWSIEGRPFGELI